MDQFYWEANRDTLLGFQMPIAVVGLRPQRYLREPIAYWDHGLIREFCPDADVCVIGNSSVADPLELRSEDTAANRLQHGSAEPGPDRLAHDCVSRPPSANLSNTPSRCTLTLPANVDEPHQAQGIRRQCAYVPDMLPSHV